MLLERLCEYADRLDDPLPTLYRRLAVRYIIELDGAGHLLSPEPIDTADPSSRQTARGQHYPVPDIPRAGTAIKPRLLADNAEYTLGLPRDTTAPALVARAHEAYLAQVRACLEETRDPGVAAVMAFLEQEPGRRGLKKCGLKPENRGERLTFRVDGAFVTQSPDVQGFWARLNDPAQGADVTVMQCLVCGQERPVLRRLQATIKGIPGSAAGGMSLISANEPAYESYGLKNSLRAPTCARCGARFTRAANALLADQDHHIAMGIAMGDAVFIFWTRSGMAAEEVSLDVLTDPKAEQVAALLAALRDPRLRQPHLDEVAFYGAVLAAAGPSRVAVRDWIDTTLGAAQRNIAQWFSDQEVFDGFGDLARPLGIYALSAATVRQGTAPSRRTPPLLLRAALSGQPLPLSLLAQVVQRNRAEGTVTRQRAALIKLILRRLPARPAGQPGQETGKEDHLVTLDLENSDLGYLCGRAFAVYEDIQHAALPEAKTTVGKSFFAGAVATPEAVFRLLDVRAQPHLALLQRDHMPAYRALRSRLEDILERIPAYPTALTVTQQAQFSLGYHHQHAADRARARAAKQNKIDEDGTEGEQIL